jgi:hypothetical protein
VNRQFTSGEVQEPPSIGLRTVLCIALTTYSVVSFCRIGVNRYLRAMPRAMRWVHANKEEAMELAAKSTGIDLKYTRIGVEDYLKRGIYSSDGSVNREGFQRCSISWASDSSSSARIPRRKNISP